MSNIIETKSLSKIYTRNKKNVFAIQDISLQIKQGTIYGIIGMSGAGKSTLIRCLASLNQPTSGTIFFEGTNIVALRGKSLREFRKNIGMIFQHFNLLDSRSAAGNISYPLEIAGLSSKQCLKRVDELLELVGLSDKKDAYPSQLSGGEKQRIGIARALANNPKVLFCDEATSALDPKTTGEILELLSTINKEMGLTIVLITHEMEVVKRICDRVAVIEHGRIVEEGPALQLFTSCKHPTTKRFLDSSTRDIPLQFLREDSVFRKLLRLKFEGEAASQPIISQMIKNFDLEVNILQGRIDHLQSTLIGTLIIELTGSPQDMQKTFLFLNEKNVHYEILSPQHAHEI